MIVVVVVAARMGEMRARLTAVVDDLGNDMVADWTRVEHKVALQCCSAT